MAKTSRKNRKFDEMNRKIDAQDQKVNTLENEVKRLRREFDAHAVRHITDDLQAERFPGSSKPKYTYAEVAERNNTSPATVARIAEEHGLSRRKVVG